MDRPDRFVWATKSLGIKPDFNILEIGCGAGIFADCIATELSSGKILAIDRSAPMITKAIKRNQHHIDAGKATFLRTEFLELEFRSKQFDRVVAFNVSFFLKDPALKLPHIRHGLQKNGQLCIFLQAPFEITRSYVTPLRIFLKQNKFDVEVTLKKLKPTSALAVIATPRA